MTIKRILAPFYTEMTARPAFASAAVIAAKFKAHISAVHLRQPMPYSGDVYFPLGGVFSPPSKDAFTKAQAENAGKLEALFQELCKEYAVGVTDVSEHTDDRGVTASWLDKTGDWQGDLGLMAGACDLAIMTAPGEEEWSAALAEALLFHSGKPLLLCPPTGIATFPESAFVAWNKRPESVRAISVAMPFLTAAHEVKIVTVYKQSGKNPPTIDLAPYLTLHGADATQSEVEVQENVDIGGYLLAEIKQASVDLVVMGAYSHSRLRQVFLGGFTKRMLRQQDFPVLMMH
jgi:nucleotide-binding universal stress UspA family protein